MTAKDKLRKINHLMGKNPYGYLNIENTRKILNDPEINSITRNGVEIRQIFTLSNDLKLSDSELSEMWSTRYFEQYKRKIEYKKKPQKEGRDNKDVLVGNGGSNGNKIRYPSKKRSIKTWKKFYKLFPHAAIQDGFDGKTSSKMV